MVKVVRLIFTTVKFCEPNRIVDVVCRDIGVLIFIIEAVEAKEIASAAVRGSVVSPKWIRNIG
jgi:hypothetical protein